MRDQECAKRGEADCFADCRLRIPTDATQRDQTVLESASTDTALCGFAGRQPWRRRWQRLWLTPEPESLDQLLITHRSIAPQILEQSTPLAHDPQQTAARMMIFRVRLEVIGQLVDALGQECDLDFGRARVLVVDSMGRDDGLFAFRGDQAEASVFDQR